jgi:hypothetical protein
MKQRIENIVRNTRAPVESRIDPQSVLAKSFPSKRREMMGSRQGNSDLAVMSRSKSFSSSRSQTAGTNATSAANTTARTAHTNTNTNTTKKTAPKPKVALFHGRKPDPEVKQLLKTMRLNEGKLEVTVSCKT